MSFKLIVQNGLHEQEHKIVLIDTMNYLLE